MKQVIKQDQNRSVTAAGEAILEAFRANWGKTTIKRQKVALVEGKPDFVETTEVVDSPFKRMNQGIEPATFIHFASLVKPEDVDHLNRIIATGKFEVVKAIQAFEIAPKVAADKSINPVTWEEAERLNSPSFATVSKYKGKTKSADLVFLLLYGFAQKFGRRNDLTEELIREAAEEIVAVFYAMTVADLKVILTRSLRSKKIFNLDYQTLISLIDEGFRDKIETSELRSAERHDRTKVAKPDPDVNHPTMTLDQQIAEVKLLSQVFDANR